MVIVLPFIQKPWTGAWDWTTYDWSSITDPCTSTR